MSLVTVLAIVITVLTCLHITYTVTYPTVKDKIAGTKNKTASLTVQVQQQAEQIKKLTDLLQSKTIA